VKHLERLHEPARKGSAIAVLLDPHYPEGDSELPAVEAATRGFERTILVVRTESPHDFDAAFVMILQAGASAIQVCGSPYLTSHR